MITEPSVTHGYAAVVVNPAAAGGRGLNALPEVVRTLNACMPHCAVHITTGPGDAEEQARRYADDSASLVIAVGGDGTFNEVANGLLKARRRVPMGIIPAGSGCDFPRSIGVSFSIQSAAEQICRGTRLDVDVGLATCGNGASRYFLNVAGLGFDAVVAERAAKSSLPGARLPYLTSLALSLASYRNIAVSLDCDGEPIDTRAVFVTIANARYFGGGLMIAPMADFRDGLLDLAIIGDIGRAELVRQVPGVYRGRHVTHAKFSHRLGRRIVAKTVEPALVQVDGELLGYAPVTFEVLPRALTLAI